MKHYRMRSEGNLAATAGRADFGAGPGFRARAWSIGIVALLLAVQLVRGPVPAAATASNGLRAASAGGGAFAPGRVQAIPNARTVTPSPTPTAGPQADACAQDADTVPADWTSEVCDSFDDNTYEWPTGPHSDDYVTTQRTVEEGVYRWRQDSHQDFFASTRYDDAQFADFYLAADVRMVDGPADAEWGLQLRRTGPDGVYSFTVNQAGQFKFDVLQESGWSSLVDWTDAPALVRDEVNRLGVKAEGSQFTFYINGEVVGELTDESTDRGFVGLATGFNADESGTFEFDNFALYLPPGEEPLFNIPTPKPTARVTVRPPARATATPSRTPTATPTSAESGACPPESLSAPADWPLVVCDTFADNSSHWPTGPDNGQWPNITRRIEDESYRWDVDSLGGVYAASRPEGKPLVDFYVAVDGRRISGPEQKMSLGIQFRWIDASNFYAFEVADSQQFKVDLLYKDEWQTLMDWTKSEAIVQGEVNRLAVKVEGPQLTFYVNDVEVASLTDSRFKQGKVGVTVDVDQGEQATAEFDNFELRSPAVAATPTSRPRATATITRRASPTPTRRPTRAPTATPTPTPAAAACGVESFAAPQDWPLAFCDPFTDNANNWQIGPDNSEYANVTRGIDQGTYQWQAEGIKGAYLSAQYGGPAVSDVYASVMAHQTKGPDTTYYGLQFRWADPGNFYLFTIADSQYYKVNLYYQQQWQTVIAPTATTAIHPGEVNRVAVKAEGSQVTLYINDRQVGEFVDERLSKGKVGLAVQPEVGEESVVAFSNFEVRAP